MSDSWSFKQIYGSCVKMTKLITGCSKSAEAFAEKYAKSGESFDAKT